MKLTATQLRRIIKEEVQKVMEGSSVTLADVDQAFNELLADESYMEDAEPGTVDEDTLVNQIEMNTGIYPQDLYEIPGFREKYETRTDDSVRRKNPMSESRSLPGAPTAKRLTENIETLAKKVFVDGDRSSEPKLVKQLKKQFGDDGFTWEQTLLDIIGDEYEDSVSEFVYYSNQ